eukprot:TRINITY_DN30060_c0_g1_i1.p1 TRINITY_DN30060_c0_g1~~TRINITY_DN30060_c0_g1_i1.p1  ORF type:complete len:816 (-),score=119.78 TRINITY_DN30060_c0_g1_i1:1325-3772(-)
MEVSLLHESDVTLQRFALNKMNQDVDEHWPEYSKHLGKVEELFEDPGFPDSALAAMVASKVFYHLGEYSDSLDFALAAGKQFDISSKESYNACIVGKCLDKYIALQRQGKEPPQPLKTMFETVFESWLQRKDIDLKEILGLVIDTNTRIDLVEKVLEASLIKGEGDELLKYCLSVVNQHIYEAKWRREVLELLAKMFQSEKGGHKPDNLNTLECLIDLNDDATVTKMLIGLLAKKSEETDNETKKLCFELQFKTSPFFCKSLIDALTTADDVKDLESTKALTPILSGKVPAALHLQFLCSQNQTDKDGLNNIKTAIESRNSITHNALVIANAFTYAGTTKDVFLRDNIEWLGKATNWAKFTATASLGLLHRGHTNKSLDLLAPYLGAAQGGMSSPYQEGGALYALGLIHSPVCHDNPDPSGNAAPAAAAGGNQAIQGQQGIINYLMDAIRNAGNNEQILHGACLGLGLTAMTLADANVLSQLQDLLNQDSAVVGEAAALGIGMLMLGSGNKAAAVCDELVQYGQETSHEKITRGIAMALALIMYQKEDEADTLIETLATHKNPIFRQGAAYTLGLAYVGTANARAVERLLNMAVTDVNDDVRRYSVAFVGFVTFKRPKYCLDLIRLLHDSYNPHVRYGVALAIGISCAGTGLKDAVEVLERLSKDSVDYIRQQAFISLSMVYMHQPKDNEKVNDFRKSLEERVKDKHEDIMTKFGCIIARGILDAGGRNVKIALNSNNHTLMKNCVGMALFTQYWYWYSYILLLSLSFVPSTEYCEAEEYKKPMHLWEVKEDILNSAGMGDEADEPGPPEPFEWP